jgi:hypothetical protein
MTGIVEVDKATERLRSVALTLLGVVFVLPLVYSPPPAANIVITAALTVFTASLRTVGRTHEAEILSQKVCIASLPPLRKDQIVWDVDKRLDDMSIITSTTIARNTERGSRVGCTARIYASTAPCIEPGSATNLR